MNLFEDECKKRVNTIINYPLKFPLAQGWTIPKLMLCEAYNYEAEQAISNNHQVTIRTNNSKGNILYFQVILNYECTNYHCNHTKTSYIKLNSDGESMFYIRRCCPECGEYGLKYCGKTVVPISLSRIFN